MYFFSLRDHEIFQQWLDVFPAGKGPNAREGELHHTIEAFSRRVSKYGSFHVSRLHLPPVRFDFPVAAYNDLRDIDRIIIVLGETQRHGNRVALGTRLNLIHLRGVNCNGVLDVCHVQSDI